MAYSRKGAGNRLRVYELDTTADPNALLPTLEIEFDQTFATTITPQDSGSIEISLDQDKVSRPVWEFLKEFAIPSGTSTEDEFYEDGTIAEKVSSTTSGGSVKYVGIVWHGESHPVVPSGEERRCLIAVATVSSGSGAHTTNNEERTKPSIVFNTVQARTNVVFDAAKFNSSLVTGSSQTLPQNSFGEYVFLPIP